MNKKIYFILIFVFAISALLLGLSYSKDSGTEKDFKLLQKYDDYFRVVYSTDKDLNINNKKIDFGITNITEDNQDYVIKLINKGKNDIYYKLDGEKEKTLNKEIIFTSTLTKKSTDGDYVLHTVEITNEDEFNVELQINVLDKVQEKPKLNIFEDNKQIFTDNNGNYRYYGENVDNYIRLDGKVYRIVGMIANKLRIVGEVGDIAGYISSNNYLTVEDYLLSFDKHDLTEENVLGNKSWLNIDYRYWIESDDDKLGKMVDADVGVKTDSKTRIHYQRIVRDLEGNVEIVSGNGTMSSPYEVSYGS